MCCRRYDIDKEYRSARRYVCVFKTSVSLSLLCSLCFFASTGYVVFSTVERSLILFVASVGFALETLVFGRYFFELVFLQRDKLNWHIRRSVWPALDFSTILAAVWTSTSLLPCGLFENFTVQIYLLQAPELVIIVSGVLALLVKCVTSICLTVAHIRRALLILKSSVDEELMETVVDHNNWPLNKNVFSKPSAPN